MHSGTGKGLCGPWEGLVRPPADTAAPFSPLRLVPQKPSSGAPQRVRTPAYTSADTRDPAQAVHDESVREVFPGCQVKRWDPLGEPAKQLTGHLKDAVEFVEAELEKVSM